eukprot:TRINITY_DN7275_c0_g3_i1.p1 TRINITY_DN7275_c0_g3~~TRINITY_DN7275_c0_g3_i1.p1  ORF type:complete len:367 (+),score=93.91 TRINITY_DN7275_c0_g3_i1:1306-2406(+)
MNQLYRIRVESHAPNIQLHDMASVNAKDRFLQLFPRLCKVAMDYADELKLPQRQRDHLERSLSYNVMGGKMNRGLTVAAGLQSLRGDAVVSEEDLVLADVCGWGIEWLQAFFLVADDIMDQSVTRRGQPCWYRLEGVGNVAINDAFILEALIYRFFRVFFKDHPARLHLIDLFQDVTLKTEMGQLTDLTTQVLGQPIDWSRYTLDTYKTIVKYKTSYYSFYLPVACSMIIGGITSEEAFEVAEKICLAMGEYFQIQDDFLDCYGDPEVIGKIGTDIEDGKCCWLVVQALNRADEAGIQTIKTHYGTNNHESVEVIKKLYAELNIKKIFEDYEDACYVEINRMIDEQQVLPKAIFVDLLAKIFKRQK